jgi:hypothetical protein
MSIVTMSVEKTAGEKRRPRRAGARGLRPSKAAQASSQARRQAAAILEVLAGLRRPEEAARVLGTSLVRYYHRERRALDGLLAACEPVPRGPRPDLVRQVRRLEKEVRRLERECGRQQALVRAAERSLGLAMPPAGKAAVPGKDEKPGTSGKRRRSRRPTVRALKAARALRQADADPSAASLGAPGEAAGIVQSADPSQRMDELGQVGIIPQACTSASPTVGDAPGSTSRAASGPQPCPEEAHSSTEKTAASPKTSVFLRRQITIGGGASRDGVFSGLAH